MNARDITLALGGRWYGRYGLTFCPAHPNTRTPALRLRDGAEGRLLAICAVGCSFTDVVAALRERGLLEDRGRAAAPDPLAEMRRRKAEREERERDTRRARAVLAETVPIADTLAERYLRARAITGPLPDSLRFHPACFHGPTATRHPAMVAAVVIEGEVEPVAVHRTRLAEPGRKADLEPNRMMLGPCAGGAVRLAHGAGPLVVAEGIETALSLRDGVVDRDPNIWAALSTSGVSGLRLPKSVGELLIAPDGDAPGRKAAEVLASRAYATGWSVRILPPPGEGLDWNDAARMEGVE
ncbi:MAG: toprim domain-containing protein [Pseudomonadota bacterium]